MPKGEKPIFCHTLQSLTLILGALAAYKPASGACLGPKNGKKLVFLVGLEKSGEDNRQAITQIMHLSQQYAYRVWVAKHLYQHRGVRRWNHPSQNIAKDLAAIKEQARSCLSSLDNLIWVGFSNGGYFINRAYTNGLFAVNQTLITVGAAGNAPQSSVLPGRLTVAAGSQETTRPKAELFFQQIEKKNKDVTLQIFTGGHVMPKPELLHHWIKASSRP